MLLERDRELQYLRQVVDDLAATGGKVVLVRGEAGIGKSALVSQLARACAPAVRVLDGACDDLYIPMPFAPFWDIARTESRIQPALDEHDREGVMRTLLEVVSEARPTLLIVEDTQWADEASLDAIRFLGRRIARTNAAVVLTYRDGEIDLEHPLRTVIGDIPVADVVRVQLGGLSRDAVAEMVAGSGLDPERVFEATGGNPLLAREMATAAGEGMASSLQDAVMARVARLSIGAQEAVKTLCVIPEPVPRSDVVLVSGIDDDRLDEGIRRELLVEREARVEFRHELLRRVVEASLSVGERLAKHRAVLAGLPEETHPCLIIHCAVQADDVDRLLVISPRSARYAAAVGSHVQAVEDFRTLGPHLDRVEPGARGPLLDEWAEEEFFVDRIDEALRLNEMARELYRATGVRVHEARALTRAAQYHEVAGQRQHAVEAARQAVAILEGSGDRDGLARALEITGYLQLMAGEVSLVPQTVERILAVGGADLEPSILLGSLNHLGTATSLADYPNGHDRLEDAYERAEAIGDWYQAAHSLVMRAWTALEHRDLRVAGDMAQRAVALCGRHELSGLERVARGLHARMLELSGSWDQAADIARGLADEAAIGRLVALPVLGIIEARRARPSAAVGLQEAWRSAIEADEFQRLSASAAANTEYAWIVGHPAIPLEPFTAVLREGTQRRLAWPTGLLAFWLWKAGHIEHMPEGVADPYRLVAEGRAPEAAALLEARGMPYEQALMLAHGNQDEQLRALEILETLGAPAVAAKLRRAMREQGFQVPRGRGRDTRRNAAGLTARQAEVLLLLDAGHSNPEIANRLFVSPRTVESHVAAILDKLDADTREAAVARARQDGLLLGIA